MKEIILMMNMVQLEVMLLFPKLLLVLVRTGLFFFFAVLMVIFFPVVHPTRSPTLYPSFRPSNSVAPTFTGEWLLLFFVFG
jgi:hypothetical protein